MTRSPRCSSSFKIIKSSPSLRNACHPALYVSGFTLLRMPLDDFGALENRLCGRGTHASRIVSARPLVGRPAHQESPLRTGNSADQWSLRDGSGQGTRRAHASRIISARPQVGRPAHCRMLVRCAWQLHWGARWALLDSGGQPNDCPEDDH
ncbi:uncharacterized protein SPPG_07061 [Spizellomyces punctatus DAOM BR117]|uniref:Uncharacterized protein n=1 Tax=Spizellomyces punctatus (strain DAOM BR117) TaxID=645134 RepID=A0A0L0H9C2_SPIPD|nr:uncharacterized protein SPPG_07061 [Spizellomyces punctatus DAOM BR117]KNC97591.1 hypothetical protein SPPG_07061 [Spizellomyces punctatus DAOM BR117]|eukprot:XP_016605631.1 hypothetical protein SPPG_07061 [Spizellomyces punctatus DAOM BR117]